MHVVLSPPTQSRTVADRHRTSEERPYQWSQRWHDDPPIWNHRYGHERVIYLGNGEWQPLG